MVLPGFLPVFSFCVLLLQRIGKALKTLHEISHLSEIACKIGIPLDVQETQ